MTVLVTGGRTYRNRARVAQVLDMLGLGPDDLVVHGDAPGADHEARDWARSRGVPERGFPADWDRWGRPAGAIRNTDMLFVAEPAFTVAFPSTGPGTLDMCEKCDRAGVFVWRIDGGPAGYVRQLGFVL